MPVSDIELIGRSRSGDLEAFDALVVRHKERVCRTVYLLIGNRDDVEDVAQEVFIRAYRHLDSFRSECEFTTWLHKVTVNTLRNWLRSRKSVSSLEIHDPNTAELAPEGRRSDLLTVEDHMELRQALDSLPLHYREAIVLRHFQELSYEEIAEIQEVPVGTVRSRLAKGRELLCAKLTRAGFSQHPTRSVAK